MEAIPQVNSRAFNGDAYDRAVLPSIASGVVVAILGLLALLARRRRPSLYLASGLVFLPSSFLSFAGLTLPLLLIAAMAFVAYGRHADEQMPAVWAPLTAVVLFILTIASLGVMLFNGGDDPACSGDGSSCTSDVITNTEALAGLAVTLLTLAVAWLLSTPRSR